VFHFPALQVVFKRAASSPEWARDFSVDIATAQADVFQHVVVERRQGFALTVGLQAIEKKGHDEARSGGFAVGFRSAKE
jgi:hypothetical protein